MHHGCNHLGFKEQTFLIFIDCLHLLRKEVFGFISNVFSPGGELKGLEWLVKGEAMPSSWATPRSGTAETHIDLTLQSSHDHSDLVCRLTTLEKSPLSQSAHDPTFYPEYHEQPPTTSQSTYSTSSMSPKEELETNETFDEKSTPNRKSRITNREKTMTGVDSPNRDGEYTTAETENSHSPYSRKENAGGDDTDTFFRSSPGHDGLEAAPKPSRKRLWESTITDVSILIQMYCEYQSVFITLCVLYCIYSI